MSAKYGLLGRRLSHSFSPMIHSMLCGCDYGLIEREPDELDRFFERGDYDGFNVTIPYKKAVIPYMAELTDAARRCGSVNTVVRRDDGTYLGDNTDFYGFSVMLAESGIDVRGKKVLVLGNGGVAPTVREVLSDFGAGQIVTISRSGEDNYENLERHADAAVIVNTTPVGMSPNFDAAPVELECFPRLEGVLDLIFNPLRTNIMLAAEARGIKAAGGLLMLAAQAVRASERFTGNVYPEGTSQKIEAAVRSAQSTIYLIGMPGCGKSTIGRALAKASGRDFIDTDVLIQKKCGISCGDIIKRDGEAAFRAIETEVMAEVSGLCGKVIATGGGVVTRPENLPLMRRCGVIVFLDTPLERLSTKGRPLSAGGADAIARLAEARLPLYRAWADATFRTRGIHTTVRSIERGLGLL